MFADSTAVDCLLIMQELGLWKNRSVEISRSNFLTLWCSSHSQSNISSSITFLKTFNKKMLVSGKMHVMDLCSFDGIRHNNVEIDINSFQKMNSGWLKCMILFNLIKNVCKEEKNWLFDKYLTVGSFQRFWSIFEFLHRPEKVTMRLLSISTFATRKNVLLNFTIVRKVSIIPFLQWCLYDIYI